MHHTEPPARARQAWLTALYLGTALVALALHRTTDLGMVGSVAAGFAIAAALLSATFANTVRRRR